MTKKKINLQLFKNNSLSSFSVRELSIMLNCSPKKAWQMLKRLSKYSVVSVTTKKSITFYKPTNTGNFLNELRRSLE